MERFAESLQLTVGEIPKRSSRNCAQLQRSNSSANEFDDGIADLVKHLADDAVSTFVDHDPNNGAIFGVADWSDHFRQRPLAIDHNATPEAIENFRRWVTIQECFVLLVDSVARMHNAIGDFTIVRQQQEPLGLPVESSDRYDALIDRYEIHDGVSAAFVGGGRDVAARLVEQNVSTADGRDQLPVDLNLLRAGIDLAAQFGDDLTIDSDASIKDQFLGAPS